MAVMDLKEFERRSRRAKIFSLIAAFVMFLAVLGIGLASGRLAHESPWEIAAVLAVMALLMIVAIVLIMVGFGVPPREYLKRRAETAQWMRWHNCLYTYPGSLTLVALLLVGRTREWTAGKREWHVAVWVAFMAVIAAMYLGQLLGGRRGEPGTPERRQFELLNDELGRTHAGEAYRWGFYAFFLGMVGVMAAALFAPLYAASAGVVAFWLGCVTASVRFGLLQRAAEPRGLED